MFLAFSFGFFGFSGMKRRHNATWPNLPERRRRRSCMTIFNSAFFHIYLGHLKYLLIKKKKWIQTLWSVPLTWSVLGGSCIGQVLTYFSSPFSFSLSLFFFYLSNITICCEHEKNEQRQPCCINATKGMTTRSCSSGKWNWCEEIVADIFIFGFQIRRARNWSTSIFKTIFIYLMSIYIHCIGY